MTWLKKGSLAALDQAWLSAINFGISIAFIRYGEKSEYGLYILLLTPLYLIQGIQNALFLSPFATIFPQRVERERDAAMRFLVWGQVSVAALAATLGLVCYFGYALIQGRSLNLWVGAGFGLAILGATAREGVRSLQYVKGQPGVALVGDLIYGVVVVCGVALFISASELSAAAILAIGGVAGLLPTSLGMLRRNIPDFGWERSTQFEFWTYSRWALLGVVITWGNLNFYPYVAAQAYGVHAVADINAARIFMMPLMLALPTWSNMLRPHFASWFSDSNFQKMRSTSKRSISGGLVLLVGYLALISFLYNDVEKVLGTNYHGLFPLILAWTAYFAATLVRTVLMANLMVNESGYKKITQVSMLGLLVLGPAMFLAAQGEVVWVILALTAIEIVQTTMVFIAAREVWSGSNHV